MLLRSADLSIVADTVFASRVRSCGGKLDKKYILQLRQIHFALWTNTFVYHIVHLLRSPDVSIVADAVFASRARSCGEADKKW